MPDIFDQLATGTAQAYLNVSAQAGTKSPAVAPTTSQNQSESAPKAGDIFDQLASEYSSSKPQIEDPMEKALNYHTGNKLVDAPMGVLQGIGKGVMSTVTGIGDITGASKSLSPEQREAYTKPNGIGQGTGKFLEQAAEFAAPAGLAGDALKGAPLAVRGLAQAGVGGAVSAAQSGGDPLATATGAIMGGAGELAGPAVKGVASYAKKQAPTFENFANSFKATPLQKKVIQKALPQLQADGHIPTGNLEEMQSAVKQHLDKLGQEYDALPQDIPTRSLPAQDVISELENVRKSYERNGVPLSANKEAWSTVNRQIKDVARLSKQNGGKITFDDLKALRDAVNDKTNFQSPKAEKDLWKKLGDAYRSRMDSIAPETTDLNRRWAQYKELEEVADENVARGKAHTKSGLDYLEQRVGARIAGEAAGATIGHAVAGPLGGAVGAAAGGYFGPKLAAPAVQALKNFAENGGLQKASPVVTAALRKAVQAGDSQAVQRIIGGVSKELATDTTTLHKQ